MRHFKITIYVCSFLISSFAYGQEESYNKIEHDPIGTDSTKNQYYESTVNRVNVKFDVNSSNERFEVAGPGFDYDIRPNSALLTTVSVNYKFISFGYSFLPKFIPGNNDDELRGKTKGFGLGLNLIFSHFIQEFQYSNIRGYYIHNSARYIPDFKKDSTPYIQLPDQKVTAIKAATYYKFNRNYSLKSIRSQTEIQKKSTGSLIIGLIYSFYIIDNKSDDPKQTSSQQSNAYEGLLSIGYNYNFVIHKKMYIALSAAPSYGLSYTNLYTRFPTETIKTQYSSPVFRINGEIGIGYNASHLFTGANVKAYQSFRNEGTSLVSIATTGLAFHVFVGYRFGAPKVINNTVKKIEDKRPF